MPDPDSSRSGNGHRPREVLKIVSRQDILQELKKGSDACLIRSQQQDPCVGAQRVGTSVSHVARSVKLVHDVSASLT